jgi:hypothetical protein
MVHLQNRGETAAFEAVDDPESPQWTIGRERFASEATEQCLQRGLGIRTSEGVADDVPVVRPGIGPHRSAQVDQPGVHPPPERRPVGQRFGGPGGEGLRIGRRAVASAEDGHLERVGWATEALFPQVEDIGPVQGPHVAAASR